MKKDNFDLMLKLRINKEIQDKIIEKCKRLKIKKSQYIRDLINEDK